MDRLTWRTRAGTPNFTMTQTIRRDNIARSAFYQKACDRLAAYEDTGLTPEEIKDHEEIFKAYRHVCGGKSPEEIPRWIPVGERLPEDDPNIQKYTDPHMEFCSVIAYGFYPGNGKEGVSPVNRMIVRPTGIDYIDRQAGKLNEWYWGNGFEKVTHWMPMPAVPKEENDA